jgi:hypothetical protein
MVPRIHDGQTTNTCRTAIVSIQAEGNLKENNAMKHVANELVTLKISGSPDA